MLPGEPAYEIVRAFESCKLVAYADPEPRAEGGILWTIGYGHTQGVQQGDTCTNEQADVWLHEDLPIAAKAVSTLANLQQHQFDALCSFTFNLGAGRFLSSTLHRLLLNGLTDRASAEFQRWCFDGGVIKDGLRRRRACERALFIDERNGGGKPAYPLFFSMQYWESWKQDNPGLWRA